MTFKITLAGARQDDGEVPTVDVEVPALPREGDYVSHGPSGIQGYVRNVQFWLPEDGAPLVIEVGLKP